MNSVLYPCKVLSEANPKVISKENKISPSLIGLSPLSTTHPKLFQQLLVRSSTRCYPCFNLVMDRSLGFVSTSNDYVALLRLAFASVRNDRPLTSPFNVSRWLIMQKARRQPFPIKLGIGLRPFVSYGFQVLFHSPIRGSFHLSLTVLVHYRSSTSI